ncbi:rod shape-determining protein [Sphaerochaeta globosa]|uniref:Cell shape-determining protein MreB n=1 Tax=Sphaerochaeta globosa (strain ATCC BAA-1886 / DSM 22777 / Buddy) TaxID=158189 RepID=F0RUT8_SPHGB|nr:rod shape-determining protein [Sphaerochaeta globosa]ADY12516.1 cell shape determining protein MreB/Mrl [Sphaerochaeta globosa str. Buddy]
MALSIRKQEKEEKRSVGKNIGIDLGTANILVYVEGEGIITNEPSVIAFDYETNEVIASGSMAANMIGKGHHGIKIISPLNQGVISDIEATKKLIEISLHKIENINIDIKESTLLLCCPSEVTQLERDSFMALGNKLGVKEVFIEQEVKAGAIGSGLDIFSSNGSMLIDIGGGSTDIGVLSLGDIVVSESNRIAGNYFDNEIMNYLQYKHGLLIGKKTAERIKMEIGSLRKEIKDPRETWASGRDVVTGLPKKITITESEIRDVLVKPFESISTMVLKVLQNTPPELSSDIIVNGIYISGGGALIDGIDEFLHERIGMDFHISKRPLTAVVDGTKLLLKNRGSYFVKPTD